MPKFTVPVTLVCDAEITVEADLASRARYLVQLHCRKNKDFYKQLLESGLGSIRVGKDVKECGESPDEQNQALRAPAG